MIEDVLKKRRERKEKEEYGKLMTDSVSRGMRNVRVTDSRTINMAGMEYVLAKMQNILLEVKNALERPVEAPKVTVNVPPLKSPKVVVPEIKVPEIRVPEIKIPEMKEREIEKEPRLKNIRFKYVDNELSSITEIYEDGSKKTAEGFDTNNVKFNYD